MTMKHLHIVVNNDGTILALLPLRALRALLALLTLLALLALLSLLALLTLLTLVTLLALLALLTLRALLTYHITLNACTTRITRALTCLCSAARPLAQSGRRGGTRGGARAAHRRALVASAKNTKFVEADVATARPRTRAARQSTRPRCCLRSLILSIPRIFDYDYACLPAIDATRMSATLFE